MFRLVGGMHLPIPPPKSATEHKKYFKIQINHYHYKEKKSSIQNDGFITIFLHFSGLTATSCENKTNPSSLKKQFSRFISWPRIH